MELTGAERAEFIELSEATYDAALWDEADLPILRKAKREYEEEQVRERGGVLPFEQATTPKDRLHLAAPQHPEWARASMATVTTFPATRVEPAAICPPVPSAFPLSESEKVKHAESMTDEELARHVESKLRPVSESLRSNIAYIREARERFAHPGRRVPVPGQPTFTEWIRQNLGISARHVRRLLAEPKEPAHRSPEEHGPSQGKRDEMMWQAGRMAHAVLGLDGPDERDPLGVNRKAALKALAYQFLNLAGRKHIPVVVRLKELQPGDSHALCLILTQCCGLQLEQAFGSLDEPERTETLRRLVQEITNRYQKSSGPLSIKQL
jgi:hypothetical protein